MLFFPFMVMFLLGFLMIRMVVISIRLGDSMVGLFGLVCAIVLAISMFLLMRAQALLSQMG